MSITARGGYQIVDFKNIEIPTGVPSVDNPPAVIPGVYAAIENCWNKPGVLYNIMGDIEFGATVNFEIAGTDTYGYMINIKQYNTDYVIHVTRDDYVFITESST